jgi:A/G-specific adenine glycosylase
MMHAAAKKIVREHQGEFPRTAEALRELPGVGRYTASAIASIAFGEALAVVDGNVERVITRSLGRALSAEAVWNSAQGLIDESRPGDFNQAMMELGATVCLPREPLCLACAIRPWCKAQGRLPENGVKARQNKKRIAFNLDLSRDGVRLVQRPRDVSLMPGFWELPEVKAVDDSVVWQTFRHSITTTDYSVEVVRKPTRSGQRVATQRLATLPLTGLTRKILRAAKVI